MTTITDRFSGTVSRNLSDRADFPGAGADYFAASYFAARYFRSSHLHGTRVILSSLEDRFAGVPAATLTDRY